MPGSNTTATTGESCSCRDSLSSPAWSSGRESSSTRSRRRTQQPASNKDRCKRPFRKAGSEACLDLAQRCRPVVVRLRFPEPARGVDRCSEVQTLVLGLLDQHDRLERVDVVDPLLLPFGRDLRLVRPVIELHLRDARDLADLAEVQLDFAEVLGEVDRLEKVYLPADCHIVALFFRWVVRTPCFKGIPRFFVIWKRQIQILPLLGQRSTRFVARRYACGGVSSPVVASPLSSAASTTGARLDTVSPGRGRITITPWVARPERLMSSTAMRITVPPLEMSMT